MLTSHVSDTHGYFPDLHKEAEIIIHSGDLCPNKTRGNRSIEIPYQSEWVKGNAKTFKDWIGDRPFLLSYGNHDFSPYICRILQLEGINAINITNTKVTLNGVRYFGFPHIPYIEGEWNCESTVPQMQKEIRRLKDELESGIDILVAHSPIAGILDLNSDYERCGNRQMADLFNYMLDDKFWPKAYLCGHIHQDHGISSLGDMIISNAATTVNLIEVSL